MAKLQLKRGNKVNLPVLAEGEPGFVLDENKLYVGNGSKNVAIGAVGATSANGSGEVFNDYAHNIADGAFAHAEGVGTIAAGANSHVEGKYNLADTANTYAHLLGNGSSITARSNAHTVDWNGNGWFAGTVTTGSGRKKLATEEYVLANAGSGGVDVAVKADKVTGAVSGNLAALDSSGNLTDSGKAPADFEASGVAGTVQTNLTNHAATQGSATVWGHLKLADSVASTATNQAATAHAVKQAYDQGVAAYNLANSNGCRIGDIIYSQRTDVQTDVHFLPCDGRVVSAAAYPALNSAIAPSLGGVVKQSAALGNILYMAEAGGYLWAITAATLYRSVDGLTWTAMANPPSSGSNYTFLAAKGNIVCVIIGYQLYKYFINTATWHGRYISTGVAVPKTFCILDNGELIVPGKRSSGNDESDTVLQVKTDMSYTTVISEKTNNYEGCLPLKTVCQFDNGRIFCLGENNKCFYSDDNFLTKTDLTSSFANSKALFMSVTDTLLVNNRLYILNWKLTNNTWADFGAVSIISVNENLSFKTEYANNTPLEMNQLCYFQNKFYLLGFDGCGQCLYESTNLKSFDNVCNLQVGLESFLAANGTLFLYNSTTAGYCYLQPVLRLPINSGYMKVK